MYYWNLDFQNILPIKIIVQFVINPVSISLTAVNLFLGQILLFFFFLIDSAFMLNTPSETDLL